MPNPNVQQFVLECIHKRPYSGDIIDLGAGDCSVWYRGLFKEGKYTTLDIKQNQNKDIDIIDDILVLSKVDKGHYDVALFLETLEHVKYPFRAFEKISQIIRPGGMLICTTVAVLPAHNWPADYWRFMPAGLRLLCEHANLEVFHEKQSVRITTIPCQTMIAALKP